MAAPVREGLAEPWRPRPANPDTWAAGHEERDHVGATLCGESVVPRHRSRGAGVFLGRRPPGLHPSPDGSGQREAAGDGLCRLPRPRAGGGGHPPLPHAALKVDRWSSTTRVPASLVQASGGTRRRHPRPPPPGRPSRVGRHHGFHTGARRGARSVRMRPRGGSDSRRSGVRHPRVPPTGPSANGRAASSWGGTRMRRLATRRARGLSRQRRREPVAKRRRSTVQQHAKGPARRLKAPPRRATAEAESGDPAPALAGRRPGPQP